MKHFYKGGRGLYLPERNVETQCIASLRPKQRNQDIPQYIIGDIRRGRPACLPDITPNLKGRTHRCAPTVLLIIFFVSMLFNNVALAQSRDTLGAVAKVGEVSIGHSVPSEFWTTEHLFYVNGDTVRKTLEEHKGKMLVLDFWSSGCIPCMLHQKEIKKYTERHRDDLVVIMVNSKNTREGYERIDQLYRNGHFEKFDLPDFESIIEDGYLLSLFPYTSFPHYVWINSRGRLQLRTFRNLLDDDYVAPFIDRP